MVDKKLVLYIGGGALALVGGYFVYKTVVKESARKSMEGMVSGIGGQGLKMIGFDPANVPFIGKKESAQAIEKMQTASPHSAKSATAVRAAGTGRTGVSLAAGHGAPKMSRPKPVSFRPQMIGREATPMSTVKSPITARPVARTRARAKIPARTAVRTPARVAGPSIQQRPTLRRSFLR